MNAINFVVNDEEVPIQNEESFASTAAKKNGQNIYSFRPFRFTKCIYKNNHPFVGVFSRFVVSDMHLYCLVSLETEDSVTYELWSFNFASGRWKLVFDSDTLGLCSMCEIHGLASYYNALICYGGTKYHLFGDGASNTTCVLTTASNPTAMDLQVTGDIPMRTINSGILIHDDNMYVIGGYNGPNYSCDVFRLHLGTKVWSKEYTWSGEVGVELAGRYGHTMCCDGHFIYVLGGSARGVSYGVQKVPAYHLRRKYWNYFDTLPDEAASTEFGFPVARACISCGQHTSPGGDMEVYILAVDVATLSSEFWRLNLRTKQWTHLRFTVSEPILFRSAALTQSGCMYSFGSSDGFHFNEEYSLYKMWVVIPSLSEICWEALCFYNPNLNTEKALNMGVPNRFVERFDTDTKKNARND